MGALDRLRALVSAPTDRSPAPSPATADLIVVRLRTKYVSPLLGTLNVGEIAGFRPALAEQLIREGDAQRVGPGAVSRVAPRPEPAPPQDDAHLQRIRRTVETTRAWFPNDDLDLPRGETDLC